MGKARLAMAVFGSAASSTPSSSIFSSAYHVRLHLFFPCPARNVMFVFWVAYPSMGASLARV